MPPRDTVKPWKYLTVLDDARAFSMLICVGLLLSWDAPSSAQAVSYNRDIRPLLSNRCFACHGPDAESRESDWRLDQGDGPEGPIGAVIEPGSIDDSELWNRVSSDDEDERMPPADSHLERLSDDELELIKAWIESGAKYEGYWAFEPVAKPTLPKVENSAWSLQPIDLFVLKKLESLDLQPAEEADPRTLIRRATFDLTGLPPTRDEIAAFLKAHSVSAEDAWEQLVDDLLSRPQYGEHVARYWLDLVRFADTNGMHKDFYRNHFSYRDWVIRAFNDNLGYDDFLRYQLAGDLYSKPTHDQLIASSFNRLHLIIDVGTALPEESFAKNVIDRVTAVGTGFMGLTVHCAQCHDHKYDPISQKDFYALSAFFNNLDAKPETDGVRDAVTGLQPPFISLGTPGQQNRIDEFDRQIAALQRELKTSEDVNRALPKELEATEVTDAKKKLAQKVTSLEQPLETLRTQLETLQQQRQASDDMIPKAMVMKERAEVRPTFVLKRGQYDAPGEQVQRDTPGFLPPLKKSSEVASRMDLAHWMLEPQHPLTARVAVNRFWQQFFGVGIVKTSEDFGNQGEVPTHPELLDQLAVSFVDSGWDVKRLMKQIVLSKTYRQSATATPEQFNRDPENRLLARGSRYRLDAEMIRDQILATSGSLSPKMYGPSVKPPQPAGLWKAVSMIGETFKPDTGDAIYRRSVYTFWKRAMPPPQLIILNAPIRDACIARRERTNTPSQALLLLNEREYLLAARRLAQHTLEQPAEQRIDFAWETVTSRLPDSQESFIVRSLLSELLTKYGEDAALTDELCRGVELASTGEKAELSAWTIVGNVLYNLDITKTKE